MSALPALLMSWLAAVPTSFGAGWLLSQGKPASVALIFLLSLAISMDIANRAGLEKGMFYGLAGLMAAILTVVSYTPWMVALKKDPKSAGAKALPISGLLFAVVTLAFAIGFGFVKQKEGGLQGGLITLMYVFVSGSMGYSGAQAKTNPSAKGNTIYMLGLLVLLTMFDVSGALQAKTDIKPPSVVSSATEAQLENARGALKKNENALAYLRNAKVYNNTITGEHLAKAASKVVESGDKLNSLMK